MGVLKGAVKSDCLWLQAEGPLNIAGRSDSAGQMSMLVTMPMTCGTHCSQVQLVLTHEEIMLCAAMLC